MPALTKRVRLSDLLSVLCVMIVPYFMIVDSIRQSDGLIVSKRFVGRLNINLASKSVPSDAKAQAMCLCDPDTPFGAWGHERQSTAVPRFASLCFVRSRLRVRWLLPRREDVGFTGLPDSLITNELLTNKLVI